MRAWKNYLLGFLILVIVAGKSFGAEVTAHTAVVKGPFCGLLSVYAALRAQGSHVEFPDLLKDKYISSPLGSSSAELIAAIKDNGLYATPFSHLSTRSLGALTAPTILHVKGDQYSKQLDHFVTCFGVEAGNLKIFDSPGEVRYIKPGELEMLWEGDGILVTKQPISRILIQIKASKPYAIGFSIIGAIIAMVVWRSKKAPSSGRADIFKRATLIALTSFAWGIAFDYYNDTSSFAIGNVGTDTFLKRPARPTTFPTADYAAVKAARESGGIIIDARLSSDFDAGHIPGAMSIPVNAFLSELQESMKHYSVTTSIVLYCQSTNCEFSDVIANKLLVDGYRHISIYRGGWVDWCKNGGGK